MPYFQWPLTALNASDPKIFKKKSFWKISKFVKIPNGSHIFSFVWRHEPDTKAPPPLSKLTKWVFLRSYDVPTALGQSARCVDTNLLDKPPNFSSLLKTLLSNVIFAFGVFHILSAWINISGFNFYFVWLEIMQRSQ